MTIRRFMTSAAVLLILDAIWIYSFMGKEYMNMVRKIQGSSMKVRLWAVVSAYCLMLLGLQMFILPMVRNTRDAVIFGGGFGLIVYGIYDLTCLVVFSNFSVRLAVIDICWGIFVYAMAALASLSVQ